LEEAEYVTLHKTTMSTNGVADNIWMIESCLPLSLTLKAYSHISTLIMIEILKQEYLYQSYIEYLKDYTSYDRSNHMDKLYHLVREQIQQENTHVVKAYAKKGSRPANKEIVL